MMRVWLIPPIAFVAVWLLCEVVILTWEAGSPRLEGGLSTYLRHIFLFAITGLLFQLVLGAIARVAHDKSKKRRTVVTLLIYVGAWLLGVFVFVDHYGDLIGAIPWFLALMAMGLMTVFVLRRVSTPPAL